MLTKRLVYLPVDVLWEYREFKRDEIPAPKVPFFNMFDVNQVTEHVRLHGLTPVELSVIGEKALLTDGNHRLVAAKRLGYDKVPVYITAYPNHGEEVFYTHTLDRFKQITVDLRKLF